MKKRYLIVPAACLLVAALLYTLQLQPTAKDPTTIVKTLMTGDGPTTPSSAQASSSSNSSQTSSASPSLSTTNSEPKPTLTSTEIIAADGTRYPLRPYTTFAYDDPRANQWWTGTINLQPAWDLGPASYTPTIAIIDTGFALDHEEFTGRWAINTADPVNGIDDDGNGLVDDWRGWDFAYGDNLPQAGTVNPSGTGTLHGSMSAGAAAATAGNTKGIAGVSQTAKILPVQVMNDDSAGNSFTVGQGVIYAAQRHADVINISLGTDGDDPYLHQAIDYAIGHGSIVVASAGNGGDTANPSLAYPAAYPEVVAVGSVGKTGTPSGFSSYGPNLAIMAPGEDMILPAWSAARPTNGYVSGAAGTSFSAPLVTGTLATLKSLSPSSTGGELIAALKETADHKTMSPDSPRSATLGFGVLNAGAAAARVVSPAATPTRYLYGSVNDDALGSARAYSCYGTYPSAELFEIDNSTAKNGRYGYTISPIATQSARDAGLTVRSLGYQCVGQPSDRPVTTRLLNLNREIH